MYICSNNSNTEIWTRVNYETIMTQEPVTELCFAGLGQSLLTNAPCVHPTHSADGRRGLSHYSDCFPAAMGGEFSNAADSLSR